MELCSQITGGWSCPRMSLLSRLDATIDSWMPLTDTHQKQSLSGFWKKLELSAYVGYISTKIIFPCKIHQCISVPKVKSWHVDEVVGLGYVMICTCFLMHELLIKTMRKISPSFIYSWDESHLINYLYYTCISITLFENHQKCRIWIFQFWHFLPIFVLLKRTFW